MSNAPLKKILSDIADLRKMKEAKDIIARNQGRIAANDYASMNTMQLMVALEPTYREPLHLQELVDAVETIWVKPARFTIVAPPQNFKTTTLIFWVVATLLRNPHLRIAYISYASHIADTKGALIRKYALAAGLELSESTSAKGEWETTAGGGLYCAGIEQGITGRPADIIIVDDPYPDRKHARSRAWRLVIKDFWNDVVVTRARETTSIVVQHTRWTEDDLIGQLRSGALGKSKHAKYQFRHIHLKAENDNGTPLNPIDWPLEKLEDLKLDQITWWSLFQGEPRPNGSKVFRDKLVLYKRSFLEQLQSSGIGMSRALGADFAYSIKSSADWSVAWLVGRVGFGKEAKYYVLDKIKRQCTAPEFAVHLKLFKPHGVNARAYIGGTERGTLDYLRLPPPMGAGVDFDIRIAAADKLVRSLPTSALWNNDQILFPDDAPWLSETKEIFRDFSGMDGDDDDEIDALVAAIDQLIEDQSGRGTITGGGVRQTTAHDIPRNAAAAVRSGKMNYR